MGSNITNKYKWRMNQLAFETLTYHAVLMKTSYTYDENDDDNYLQIKTDEMAAQFGYVLGGFELTGVLNSEEPGKSVVTFPGFSAFTVSGGTFGPVQGIAIVEWVPASEALSYLVGYREFANPVFVGDGLIFQIPDLVIPHT
jgi:hypothetical protein